MTPYPVDYDDRGERSWLGYGLYDGISVADGANRIARSANWRFGEPFAGVLAFSGNARSAGAGPQIS